MNFFSYFFLFFLSFLFYKKKISLTLSAIKVLAKKLSHILITYFLFLISIKVLFVKKNSV